MPFSIRQKLAATVALSVGLSGLLTGAATIWEDYSQYVGSHRASLLASASAFSAAVAGAVAQGDADQTFEALRGIGTVPNFLHAVVTDRAGRVLSTVGLSARLDDDAVVGGHDDAASLSGLLTSRTIKIVVPVTEAGTDVGRLEVLSDASDLLPGLLRSGLRSLGGTLLALVVGLAFATRVQAAVIRPLKSLTEAMERVRTASDFTAELPQKGSDELAVLVAGYNAMLANIRERDARLQRHRDRLEQDVVARTHDLALARDEAERANAAKSDFLATMSHEIRTPMSGLLVMAELLAAGELPPRARRHADVISQSGKALLAIINDILDFAKIEAGKMDLELVEVEPDQVVGTVLNLFHARAREKGLDLAARVAPDVPAAVRADPVRLGQVVGNLVGNALKFTDRGSVTVAVSRLARGDGIRIAVSDTGIGIPADKLGTIFEAFGQADRSTTRRFGGTGLGLAISNRLVDAMGSRIGVRSTVGEGTTFAFDLQAACLRPAEPMAQPGPGSAAGAVYLAVEGDATRAAVADLCAQSGLVVHAGLPEAAADLPLLVVADVDRLRGSADRPRARYVVGLAEPEHEEVAGREAVDLVLTRPLLPAELKATLQSILRGERLAPRRARDVARALPQYPGAQVLAADDAAVNREVLIEALARFGIVPVFVVNGREAVAALERQRFDLVLMDGSMPVLDGFDATRCWRTREREAGLPRTPIVALTAHVVGTGAEAWRDAGMDGKLSKPFTMQDLGKTLAAWLSAAAPPISEPPGRDACDTPPMPLLNPAVLAEIGAVGGGFAERIIGLYRQHAPLALGQIRDAVAAADPAALASATHALKSMSHNVGALRVVACAEPVEQAARSGRLDAPGCAALEAALDATLAALAAPDTVALRPAV